MSEKGNLNRTPYLVAGSLSVVYGIMVYVFLPEALVNMDLGKMLTIFFLLLLGMIFGLSLLTTNIQPLVERLVVYILLCWEKRSMKQLI